MGNEIGSKHRNRPANERTLKESSNTQRRILNEIAFLFDTNALGGSCSWCSAARIALVHYTDKMSASGVKKYRSALARYMRDCDYSESDVRAVCGPIVDREREQVAREFYSESERTPFAYRDIFSGAEENRDE